MKGGLFTIPSRELASLRVDLLQLQLAQEAFKNDLCSTLATCFWLRLQHRC